VSFPIIDITADPVVSDEQLGSKSKFWISRDNEKWLFKEARASTGEDWAEKIASEVARLIGLNAARVELAVYAERRGCLSLSFVLEDENLVHGNEILAGQGDPIADITVLQHVRFVVKGGEAVRMSSRPMAERLKAGARPETRNCLR